MNFPIFNEFFLHVFIKLQKAIRTSFWNMPRAIENKSKSINFKDLQHKDVYLLNFRSNGSTKISHHPNTTVIVLY